MHTPESFGPVDPLQDPIGNELPSSTPAQQAGGPPAGDAIFESVARRNAELTEEEDGVQDDKKSFLDVGLKFYSDLRNTKE